MWFVTLFWFKEATGSSGLELMAIRKTYLSTDFWCPVAVPNRLLVPGGSAQSSEPKDTVTLNRGPLAHLQQADGRLQSRAQGYGRCPAKLHYSRKEAAVLEERR